MYNFIIVDDEEIIRKGTLKKIQKLNYPLTCIGEASNGLEALGLLNKLKPDFIITDMDMPLMDGTQLLDNLIKNHPNLKVIVISGFENFSYAQKAIQAKALSYILKPFSRETIGTVLTQIMETLQEEKEKKNNTSNIAEWNLLSHFIIGNITINKLPIHLIKEFSNKQLRLATIYYEQAIQAKTLTDNYILLPHPQEDNMEFVILEEDEKLNFCDRLSSFSFTSNSFLCGISEKVDNPTQLFEAYKQTITAINTKQNSETKNIFHYKRNEEKRIIHFEKINEIIFFIESGKSNVLKERLTAILTDMIKTNNLTLGEVKQIGIFLLEQTKGMLNNFYNTNTNHTLPDIYKTVYETIFSFEKLIEYFINFLSNIAESMSYEKIYASKDTIENVKSYISKYYYKDIKLDFLSDIFFLNSAYLSTLFKERTGQKYIDFLNSVRIEKAKELLNKSDRKIYQISKAVGYDNPKYFFRVFKKYTGVSPEQYKKRLQEEGSSASI